MFMLTDHKDIRLILTGCLMCFENFNEWHEIDFNLIKKIDSSIIQLEQDYRIAFTLLLNKDFELKDISAFMNKYCVKKIKDLSKKFKADIDKNAGKKVYFGYYKEEFGELSLFNPKTNIRLIATEFLPADESKKGIEISCKYYFK